MPYLTRRKNLKLQLSPGLVASYDIQPGNGVGLFWYTTHTPDPHRGQIKHNKLNPDSVASYNLQSGNGVELFW